VATPWLRQHLQRRLHVIVDDVWSFVPLLESERSPLPAVVDVRLPVLGTGRTMTLLLQTALDLDPRTAAMATTLVSA
jgi:hypothetical protein